MFSIPKLTLCEEIAQSYKNFTWIDKNNAYKPLHDENNINPAKIQIENIIRETGYKKHHYFLRVLSFQLKKY